MSKLMPIDLLSPRQTAVFEALRAGRSRKRIARELNLAPGTVATHQSEIYRRLQVRSHLHMLAQLLGEKTGSIVVEFAICFPVFALLLLGGIDLSLASMQAGAAQSGLSIGGAYLTNRSDAAGVEAVVRQSSALLGNAVVEAVQTGSAVHLTVVQPIYSSGIIPSMPSSITASGVFVLKS